MLHHSTSPNYGWISVAALLNSVGVCYSCYDDITLDGLLCNKLRANYFFSRASACMSAFI